MLRMAGVPHVLCWKTLVHDPIARELCERFYGALMLQAKAGWVKRRRATQGSELSRYQVRQQAPDQAEQSSAAQAYLAVQRE